MNFIVFVVSLVLFVGGFWVMGTAFTVPGLESLVFFAGILCSALGVGIPIHVLKRIDG